MKTSTPFLLHGITLALLFAGATNLRAQGTAFTYQGRLNDGAGPVNGFYDLRFTIYDSTNIPGTVVAGPLTNSAASVSNGLFTATMDFGSSPFTGADRWLEIAVRTNAGGAFTNLSPRQLLTPAPYALTAANLMSLSAQPLDIRVAGQRILELQPNANAPNLIGGAAGNFVAGGIEGATIAGGGTLGAFSGLYTNSIAANYSSIGGGLGNTIQTGAFESTIAGGNQNFIQQNAYRSTIGGGLLNTIQILAGISTIGGGRNNLIVGSALSGASASTIGGGDGNVSGTNTIWTTIGGGRLNAIQSDSFSSTIAGGEKNVIQSGASYATIAGGIVNVVGTNASNATIGGGAVNTNNGPFGTVGGGINNTVSSGSFSSVISGGTNNFIQTGMNDATIGGGGDNFISNARATIAGGMGNTALGEQSVVGGGQGNTASATSSTVAGGFQNSALGTDSTVSGGYTNQATGFRSVVSGGSENQATGSYDVVGGGVQNTASNIYSAVAGGYGNLADGQQATIGGGSGNHAQFNQATIAGGYFNAAIGAGTTVSGGAANSANSDYATVAGGYQNSVANNGFNSAIGGGINNAIQTGSSNSFIGGGSGNVIRPNLNGVTVGGGLGNVTGTIGPGSSRAATVAGGQENNAEGDWSAVPGGFQNWAPGKYSLAAGNRAKAFNDGAFVWADSQAADFGSSASNQFCIRAQGGVQLDPSTSLYFGFNTRQMLNLYDTAYAIGVQDFTEYFRSASTFSWFKNGVHTNAQNNPGAGGTELMRLDSSGNLKTLTGTISTLSDRHAKTNFAPINARAVLDRVASLPITTWNFKAADPSQRHIGPMAQDFYAAFDVGLDDRSICTVDADGVALAAIQGLNQKITDETSSLGDQIQARDERIIALEKTVAELKELVVELHKSQRIVNH
jgi:hypothetical protein